MTPSLQNFARSCTNRSAAEFQADLSDVGPALKNAMDAEDKIHSQEAAAAQEEEFAIRLQSAPFKQRAELKARRQRAMPLLAICLFLAAGSVLLNIWSLSMVPNDLARELLAIGLTLGTVAFVDVALNFYAEHENLLFSLAASTSVIMLGTEWLLAKARAHLMIASMQSTTIVSINGIDSAAGYDDPLLKTILPLVSASVPLLAVAWELGLSLTCFFALRAVFNSDLVFWHELEKVTAKKAMHLARAERFRAVKEDIKSAAMALRTTAVGRKRRIIRIASLAVPVAVLFLLIVLLGSQASAEDLTVSTTGNAVFLIDCSASRPAAEAAADRQFVRSALGFAAPGSRQLVILITPNSWQDGRLLLDGHVGNDPGALGQNLRSARRQLQDAFEKKMSQVQCGYRGTDVVGAVLYGQQLLSSNPNSFARWHLLSDMRQTYTVNLERMDADQLSRLSPHALSSVPLKGQTVFVLGAQTSGSTPLYWRALQNFWISYFAQSGAVLRGFFVTRELQAVISPGAFPVLTKESASDNFANPKTGNHEMRSSEAVQKRNNPDLRLFRIVSPSPGADCDHEAVVEGTGAEENDSIWILVKAVGISEVWPNKAQVKGTGWLGQIVCGRPGMDAGVRYQVMAIANPTQPLQHGVPVGLWPAAQKASQIVEVVRK